MELQGIHKKVFDDRYAAKDENGKQTEYTPEQMWDRVASFMSKAETNEEDKFKAEKNFYNAMEDFYRL